MILKCELDDESKTGGQEGQEVVKNRSDTFFQIRQLSVILSLLLLNGCASWFYTPGMSELEELCEKDGGVQIYETVEVEGYFNGYLKGCWGCWDEITLNSFEFIELEVKEGKGVDVFDHDAGYWRLEKVARESGQCHAGIEKMLMRQKNSSEMKEFIKDYCIAAEKIDKPKSRYAYFSDEKEPSKIELVFEFGLNQYRIVRVINA